MSTFAAATDSGLLESHHAEWRFLSERRCNVLLEGTVDAIDAVLHLLQPRIDQPIAWHQPPAALQLPGGEAGTLILRDTAALNRDEQRTLLAWMNEGGGTQVVATSACTLFTLVEAGLFDAALYYRLNVVLLRIDASTHGGMLPAAAVRSSFMRSPIRTAGVAQDNAEQGAVNLDAAVVLDEPELPELVHEKVHA